jgi:hypothetical protein
LRKIIYYCCSRKKQIIIGCDSNTHHIFWGNSGTNPRAERFMEYLVSSNLNILNQGNKPTFVVNRKKVIDLTLGTSETGNLVSNWHVYDKPSLSDHRYIRSQTGKGKVKLSLYQAMEAHRVVRR